MLGRLTRRARRGGRRIGEVRIGDVGGGGGILLVEDGWKRWEEREMGREGGVEVSSRSGNGCCCIGAWGELGIGG